MARADVRFTMDRGAVAELARQAEMGRYLNGIADQMAKEVARRAPVSTGALRSSIQSSVEATAKGYVAKVSAGSRKAFYWHMIEFGTSRNGAHPFIRPGVQTVLSRVGGRWKAQ